MFESLRSGDREQAVQATHLAVRVLRHRSPSLLRVMAESPGDLFDNPSPDAVSLALSLLAEIEQAERSRVTALTDAKAGSYISKLVSELMQRVAPVDQAALEAADRTLEEWRRAG